MGLSSLLDQSCGLRSFMGRKEWGVSVLIQGHIPGGTDPCKKTAQFGDGQGCCDYP